MIHACQSLHLDYCYCGLGPLITKIIVQDILCTSSLILHNHRCHIAQRGRPYLVAQAPHQISTEDSLFLLVSLLEAQVSRRLRHDSGCFVSALQQ